VSPARGSLAQLASIAAAAAAVAGCGRNAFLEIDVVLPKNDTGSDRYAVVAFAPGDQPFDAVWAGDQTLAGVKLSAGGTTTQHASLEGASERFDQPVAAKVTFCGNAACTASGDDRAPEVRLLIERAFYEGSRTTYTWTIGCVPSVDPARACAEEDRAVKTAKKCEIGGCREGTSSSYCVGDKHFCE
jgi:hypothetical protein